MSAKHKGSKRSRIGDREQAARGGKGDLPGVHENTALIPLILRNARDLIAFLDTEGRRIYNSPSYGPLLGDPEKLVGSDSFGDVHPEDRERIRQIFRDTVRTGTGHRTEYRLLARDGTPRVVQSEGSAIRDEENRVAGVVVVGRDITEERDADAKLEAALRRQKALAEFSLFALREPNPSRAIERAAALVAEALEVDFGTVLELEADGKALRVVAGHNWPPHRLGTHISAGVDTQAGHALELYRRNGAETLEAPQPVAIEDLGSDGRFVNTFRVRELGVVSAVCVVVPTAEGPYGVLAAHSRARRRFDPVEIEFMQAVANVLSAALVNFRAQAALRRQTERLRIAQHAARMIVLDWDIQADTLEFSDSPVWLRGPVPEGTGKYAPFKEQVHPEDRAHFLAARQRTIEMLQAQTPEFRVVRTDGQVLWVRSHQTVITGADGEAARMIAALYDITEHKRAEQALAESEARFRALTELSADWYWEQDENFRFVMFSPDVEEAAGSSPQSHLGKTRWELPYIDVPEAKWASHRATLEAHQPFQDFEYQRVNERGETIWMSASGVPIFDPQGRFGGYRGVGRNITERKQAELALAGSEARFRQLTALSSDWYWEQDEQFRLTFVSGDLQAKTGLDAQAYLGKRRWEIPTPNLTQQDWLRHRAQLDRHEPFRDFVMRRADPEGREVWLSVSGDPVFDEAGGFKGYRGVGSDVTDTVLLERSLLESESRFRSLTKLSSDWYWEQDDQFRFTTLSGPGAAAMSRGGDPSVYLGKARWEIPDLEHMEGDWSRHRAQLERHEPFRDLILGRRMNDGTLRYMSVSGEPVFDEAGGFKGYRGVASNITERKRVEQALRESEQRFQSFMDNVPANAFIKDSQLRYTWVNRAHELHRSDGLHDVLGCDDFQLRPPEVARALRQQDEEVLRAKGPAWFVNRIPTMDERERHFLVVKFPLPDASGAPGVAGVGIDISEQYKLEQTVRQLLRRLVHAQEAERRKVAGDLHDLIGQKLTALSLGLDIVRQLIPDAAWGPLNPRLQQMSALLEETIAAVRNVMSELRPPMLDDHGLLPALHWYASLFEAQTALQVRVAGPELGPRLDREIEIALFRIAQEALTNAAKHSGGSRVRIQVERFAEHVRMCIEDDGRGFDERTLERATKPTSWGMSAMRERAHAFGGQLRVESRAPGAAIVVDVPLEYAD